MGMNISAGTIMAYMVGHVQLQQRHRHGGCEQATLGFAPAVWRTLGSIAAAETAGRADTSRANCSTMGQAATGRHEF